MPRAETLRPWRAALLSLALLSASIASAQLADTGRREAGFSRLKPRHCARCDPFPRLLFAARPPQEGQAISVTPTYMHSGHAADGR